MTRPYRPRSSGRRCSVSLGSGKRGTEFGADAISATTKTSAAGDDILVRFAGLLREKYAARVLLFGSRARGTARADSDYDVVAVSRAFVGQRIFDRAPGRYDLWRDAGGWGIGLDLHCFTPHEFRRELAGLGFQGSAKRRGELVEVRAETTT